MSAILVLVINDLIDFNKIEANDLTADENIFVLQDLVEDVETLFTQNMAKENVEFLVDMTRVTTSAFGDGTKLLLKGDDGKIRRVVINLLSNVGIHRCVLSGLVLSFSTGVQIHFSGNCQSTGDNSKSSERIPGTEIRG